MGKSRSNRGSRSRQGGAVGFGAWLAGSLAILLGAAPTLGAQRAATGPVEVGQQLAADAVPGLEAHGSARQPMLLVSLPAVRVVQQAVLKPLRDCLREAGSEARIVALWPAADAEARAPRGLATVVHAVLPDVAGRHRARLVADVREKGAAYVLLDVDRRVARYLTVGLALMLFLASLAAVAGGWLKFRAFPDLDGDVVAARILLPQGTPLDRTQGLVDRVVAGLGQVDRELSPLQPDGQTLVRNITVQYSKNVDAFETGPHVATVTVDLLNAESRTGRLDDILHRWREAVGSPPDVLSLKFAEFAVGPAGLPIDVRLQGNDLGMLQPAAQALKDWFAGYRGAHDLSHDLRPGKPELRVHLREGALALGLDARTIAAQLRAAYFGETAAEIQVGPESYEIDVRLSPRDADSLADLQDFTVTDANGGQVPLGAVAALQPGRGYARINRIDGVRTVTVQGDIDTNLANANDIIADTKRRFLPKLAQEYPGVTVGFEGQEKEAGETGVSIRNGFLFGLIGVFLLLSMLFRSYLEPLIVMAAIPMGLVGAVWGHIVLGLDLSMPSVVGFVSLAGIVVNDSILLVVFTKRQIEAGEPVDVAARQASRRRFRAVLLTSLTTVMGLLPLLAERSLQAQVLKPLVTSLGFGLVASTVMVLFVLPALYTIFDDLKFTARHRKLVAGTV